LVLAAAAGQARLLRLKTTSLARGAYPEATKPLSAADKGGRFYSEGKLNYILYLSMKSISN